MFYPCDFVQGGGAYGLFALTSMLVFLDSARRYLWLTRRRVGMGLAESARVSGALFPQSASD